MNPEKNSFAGFVNYQRFRSTLVILGILCVLIICAVPTYATNESSTTNLEGNSTSGEVSSSNYPISTLDPAVGGDVTQNPEITNNIPRTDLANEIFEKQKQGSVTLQFGNGNGNKLLIWSGIHGNEEEANIAVMKYAEYVKTQNFAGTLYVVPFAIPMSTQYNSRDYNGYDPNRAADTPGTPGYNILQFAINNGINYIVDVHSGGGVPFNGLVYYKNSNEAAWASYIKSMTSCTLECSDISVGSVRYEGHEHYGLNIITLEVDRDNAPTSSSAEVEFRMVMVACQFFGFPGYITVSVPASTYSPPAYSYVLYKYKKWYKYKGKWRFKWVYKYKKVYKKVKIKARKTYKKVKKVKRKVKKVKRKANKRKR